MSTRGWSMTPAPISPGQVVARATGFLWETLDRRCNATGSIMVSGTTYFSLFPIMPGERLGSIAVDVTVAGSSLTLVKVAVINPADSSVVAVSADVKAAFTGTGIVVSALGSTVAVSQPTAYYAAILATGTTPPTLTRGNASTDIARYSTNAYLSGRRTGQTDITAVGPNSASGAHFWFAGVSA